MYRYLRCKGKVKGKIRRIYIAPLSPVPADLSYVNVSDRRHPTTSRCHSYGLSLASAPFHTSDRQHGILCRTAFALNQTLQSFENILKLTFFVQLLMFVNFLFIDFTQR